MGELLQSKPDGFASSLGEGAFGKEEKLYRTAKGPISEGAVTEGDWGSAVVSMEHSLRPCGAPPSERETRERLQIGHSADGGGASL